MSDRLIIATMETEHYTWTAAGVDTASALAALADAWRAHFDQIGESPTMTGERAVEYYGTNTITIGPGEAFRDFDQLVGGGPHAAR